MTFRHLPQVAALVSTILQKGVFGKGGKLGEYRCADWPSRGEHPHAEQTRKHSGRTKTGVPPYRRRRRIDCGTVEVQPPTLWRQHAPVIARAGVIVGIDPLVAQLVAIELAAHRH